MRRIRQLVCSSLLAVTAVGAAPAIANAASCSGADSSPAQLGSSKANRATLCLLNRERRAHGLRALRSNSKLARAARGHARDMVAQRYFSHDSRNGASFSTRIKRTGWTRSRRSYTMGENIGWGGGSLSTPRSMVQRLDEQRRPPRQHPLALVQPDRHRHRQRRADRRQRRDLRHRLRRLNLNPRPEGRLALSGSTFDLAAPPHGPSPGRAVAAIMGAVARGEAVRRRQAGVLVVGAAEPEIQSWLRAAGHAPRAVRRAEAAGAALEEEPVDLVIVDRDSSGLDAPAVCRHLREDPRLGDAWMLAITVAAKGRMADSVLDAGADDYLHRPFTRAELIARARAGLRAAQERANDRLLRTLMENVPGAIYRSAWHADYTLEMITDEIERISGYPPANFLASTRRTLLSIVHPEDVDMVLEAIAQASVDSDEPFQLEYRIVRDDGAVRWVLDRGQLVRGPGGRLWMDGAMFDITERRAGRGGAAAPRGRGGPDRRAARLARPHHRGRRQRPPQDRARPPRRRAAAARVARARRPGRPPAAGQGSVRRRRVPGEARPRAAGRVRRAARARPRHPPGGPDRARPGRGRRRRSPPARRCRSRSSTRPPSASRRRSRRPPTSRSPRR